VFGFISTVLTAMLSLEMAGDLVALVFTIFADLLDSDVVVDDDADISLLTDDVIDEDDDDEALPAFICGNFRRKPGYAFGPKFIWRSNCYKDC
jgi:hypothetical protein